MTARTLGNGWSDAAVRGLAATYVATSLLSEHQPGTEGLSCSCGDPLRADLTQQDGMAAHQVAMLTDAGLLVE